ncbi:MAG: cytochrome c-type biogenesis protein [Candidatus Rickettsiella isopodorum]|jgi:cytochrome c-type biogenesis protein CcmH|nr:cytochrome c-type biogenesis protein CcmH [Gammaproteobacteria bacterium]MDD4892854.1 cytochrome c-type biogenesis protein CcmH [Candidatus Rickettsiella isopodorum]MDD5162394.1 cytochrome c-type biogenesis protein CcmH [Candidatus Rickettsiella isopodorum]
MQGVKKFLKKNSLRKLFWLAIFFSPLAFSELSEMYVFDSSEKKIQFEEITHEIRCLVCQNQNLADSNAPLANDLRLVIYRRIKQGESLDQVKNYLVSRYGEFISFKPAFSRITFCLWLSPFILLLVILLILLLKIKKFDTRISGS